MTTMFLPPSRAARRPRAPPRRAAPDEMPTGMPSSRASSRAVSKAVSLPTVIDLVDDRAVEDLRHEAGADALDLVRAGLAAGQHRRVLRLDGDDLAATGLRGFSTWPTPVMVPPVPTPETKMSTSPSVSFQISSAVVRRWISGLAGFSNCCGMTAPGISPVSSSALAIAPFMPFGAGRQLELGAEQRQHLAPLDRHRLRHGQDQPVAARRGDEGERDAGVAGGRLDQRRRRA